MILALLLAAAADAGTPAAAPVPLAPLQEPPDLVPLVPPPPEYTLELKDREFRVHVNFKPGEPQPGEVVELRFDVGRQKDAEVGDARPWSEGKLALTVTGPGPAARYLVRALGDAGAYGAHWTPISRGLWTLALAPYQDAGRSVTFQVGAGEPMPVSSQGHMVQASRIVVGARDPAQPPVKTLMADLGKRWQQQSDAPRPDPAELKAMAKLLEAIEGRGKGPGFDRLAADQASALEKGALPDAASCLQCHIRFRDAWVGK